MEIVYYYNKYSDFCPVKRYILQCLSVGIRRERYLKVLSDLVAKLCFIRDNEGRAVPPIAKPLHDYGFFEILNPKDKRTVIRIIYFRYSNLMVLLHAFEKPSSYRDSKTKQDIEKEYQIAESYMNDFKNNPDNYEKYQERQ